jgi:tRNA threonylcarbamoyladenosine biosynthesis protein TsaE
MTPIYDPFSFEFISRSPAQTRRVGLRLGEILVPGDVIRLEGDLGAGKTTLVQGLGNGWGSLDPVTSPTFILINDYRRPDGGHLYHMDAYRLSGAAEAEDLDIDTYLAVGPLVVEWADRIETALPEDALVIRMRWVSDEHREIWISGKGPRSKQLFEGLRQKLFAV